MSSDDDPVLKAMYEEGLRSWPGVALDRAVFEAYVRARGPAADGATLQAGELFLVCACAEGDARALAEFEGQYLSRVGAFLAGSNATAAFADEVRQRIRERLFVDGKIRQYSGRGPLASWLRVVTVRVASNLREAERPHVELEEAVPASVIDPELRAIQRRYADAFRAALRDALGSLTAEERSLLRFQYMDGLNIDRIAVIFQVSRATIGRRMIAVRGKVMDEMHRLLRARLRATPQELESLLRVVRSDLAMSLSVILRDP
jgi:RNA polymerase sigma-70 factor (ECF subfamily)